MPVLFPVSLDDFTDPNPALSLAVEGHAARHKDITDAIEAIEATVGITDSANPLSHDARLVSLESIAAALGTAANADTADFDPAGAAADVASDLSDHITSLAAHDADAIEFASGEGLVSDSVGEALDELKVLVDGAGGGSGVSDGDYGDITVSGSNTVWTIDNDVVTNAKAANMATQTFKGRTTAGTGDPEDLTIAQAKTLLDLTGTNSGDQTITLTGGVTGSGTGSFAATVVTNANLTGPVTSVGNATALAADFVIPTVITIPNTGLHILDTNASHDLIVAPGSDLTADRTLTVTTGDADRTLTISGNTTLGGGSHSGTNTGDQTLPTRASLGLDTTDSPQFAGINLGHASDTTLARSGAGDVTIEGNAIYRAGGTDVAIADGGTGASTAAAAFANLKQDASDTATGVVELATAAETTTGTDAARAVTPDGLAGSDYGKRVVGILVSDPGGSAITTGDDKAVFRVSSLLNGWNLVGVAASVTTVSSSGIPTVQIRNATQAADMLTTKLTIDQSESDSSTAATAAVIDTGNDDVATGDSIRIDIDVAGTGAKGLYVELIFQLP